MGRLFGEANPYSVLLVGASGAEEVVADDDENECDEEVEYRQPAQLSEQRGTLVVDVRHHFT